MTIDFFLIQVDPSQRIKINFLEFDTEKCWDKLKMTDGHGMDMDLCGSLNDIPGEITTNSNYIRLQ